VRLEVGDGYHLSSLVATDRDRLVALLSDGEIAGWIPALPQPYTGESADSWIRHRVAHTQARGRGLATRAVAAFVPYAFGVLRLARLTAHTLAFNARSVRVLEKNGFLLEGRLRRRMRTAAGDHDALVFGRLRVDP